MSTKINLEFPYSEDYVSGYLNINKEPRRVVLLVRKDGTKTSCSYARYLMSCHLKRYLDKREQVDHIDEDKLNDVIENLQILTPKENSNKHVILNNKQSVLIDLVCPVCNVEFSRSPKEVRHKINKGKTPCCSRVCGGKFPHITKNK